MPNQTPYDECPRDCSECAMEECKVLARHMTGTVKRMGYYQGAMIQGCWDADEKVLTGARSRGQQLEDLSAGELILLRNELTEIIQDIGLEEKL